MYTHSTHASTCIFMYPCIIQASVFDLQNMAEFAAADALIELDCKKISFPASCIFERTAPSSIPSPRQASALDVFEVLFRQSNLKLCSHFQCLASQRSRSTWLFGILGSSGGRRS